MANSKYWLDHGLRAVLEVLADRGEAVPYGDIKDDLSERFHPGPEDVAPSGNGIPKWWNYISWGTTGTTRIGWMTKNNGTPKATNTRPAWRFATLA